jgi:hypothetical protein
MRYVCNYNSNGPYFAPTQGCFQAASLTELIMHVRMCMDDGDYQIGIFDDDGECLGIWVDEAEPEPDGEGDWRYPKPFYVLHRPGTMSPAMWRLHLNKFKRPD